MTWALRRGLIGGKLTRTVPVTSTASKNAGSVSTVSSRLSHRVPVFWAASLTWMVAPGRPGCGRTEVAGVIDFWTEAPSVGSVAVITGEQNGVCGSLEEPTDAQFWTWVPIGTPSRSTVDAPRVYLAPAGSRGSQRDPEAPGPHQQRGVARVVGDVVAVRADVGSNTSAVAAGLGGVAGKVSEASRIASNGLFGAVGSAGSAITTVVAATVPRLVNDRVNARGRPGRITGRSAVLMPWLGERRLHRDRRAPGGGRRSDAVDRAGRAARRAVLHAGGGAADQVVRCDVVVELSLDAEPADAPDAMAPLPEASKPVKVAVTESARPDWHGTGMSTVVGGGV